jgi:hypothetical protein
MSRHPAAGVRATVSPLPRPAPTAPATGGRLASFATVTALLTGPWRVNDPVAFAAAMGSAPLVAGYPVLDLSACASHPTGALDPLSAAAAGHLESAVAGAAGRAGLEVRWVAARHGPHLYVEAAARAPAGGGSPEFLAIAHLVDDLSGRGFGTADDSWVLIVVGDGQGGVAGIGRSDLPARTHPVVAARLSLGGLRARLLAPARLAEGLDGPAAGPPPEAVILPFRR